MNCTLNAPNGFAAFKSFAHEGMGVCVGGGAGLGGGERDFLVGFPQRARKNEDLQSSYVYFLCTGPKMHPNSFKNAHTSVHKSIILSEETPLTITRGINPFSSPPPPPRVSALAAGFRHTTLHYPATGLFLQIFVLAPKSVIITILNLLLKRIRVRLCLRYVDTPLYIGQHL